MSQWLALTKQRCLAEVGAPALVHPDAERGGFHEPSNVDLGLRFSTNPTLCVKRFSRLPNLNLVTRFAACIPARLRLVVGAHDVKTLAGEHLFASDHLRAGSEFRNRDARLTTAKNSFQDS